VGTDRIRVVQGQSTGICFGAVAPSGQRTLFSYRGANSCLSVAEEEAALLEGARAVHLSEPETTAGISVIRSIKSDKTMLSVDPGGVGARRGMDYLGPILRHARVFMATERECLVLGGTADLERALDGIFEQGPQLVIVKQGEGGCLVATQDAMVQVAGFAVDTVDATGAGDAFDAGFICAILEGKPPAEAALFANAVGALTTTQFGAQTSQPSRKQVENLMAKGRRQSNA
jgi:ribokinase